MLLACPIVSIDRVHSIEMVAYASEQSHVRAFRTKNNRKAVAILVGIVEGPAFTMIEFDLPSSIDETMTQASEALPDSVHSSSAHMVTEIEDCRDSDSISLNSEAPVRIDMSLPSPISEPPGSDSDACNAFDEADDIFENDIDLDIHPAPTTLVQAVVPTPAVASLLRQPQHFAEYYSPPRVTSEVAHRGCQACLALDLNTGWDFDDPATVSLSYQLLDQLHAKWVGLSPPCTVFSNLQRLWNIKRIPPDIWQRRFHKGMLYLEHSMKCAEIQVMNSHRFYFEHPARATSWQQPCVQHVSNLPGVEIVQCDQCMLGLCSKLIRIPTRKRTKVMTNSAELASSLRRFKCNRQHQHQPIHGSEGGMMRSAWAQVYPHEFIVVLADAVCAVGPAPL